MPKRPAKKETPKQVDDSDVIIAFSKGKAVTGRTIHTIMTKAGSTELFKGKTLLARRGKVDDRKLVQINLDFEDVKLLMQIGGMASSFSLYDFQFNQLLFPHLQESWNKRRELRLRESGEVLI